MKKPDLRRECDVLVLMYDTMRDVGVDPQWQPQINRRLRMKLGCCRVNKKRGLYRIEVAAPWCLRASYDDLMATILHECAHALVGLEAGHGFAWQVKARALGVSPKRTTGSEPGTVPGWEIFCPTCGGAFLGVMQRRPRSGARCNRCKRTDLRVEYCD